MKCVVVMIFLLKSNLLISQTWDEWFNQKRTKIKYLTEQVAANVAYADLLRKGYGTVSKGLELTRSLRNSEFNLHLNFIEGLKKVNPQIRDFSRFTEFLVLEKRLAIACRDALEKLTSNSELTSSEKQYCKAVIENVLNDLSSLQVSVKELFSDNNLQMDDKARLSLIDSYWKDLTESAAFVKEFVLEINLLLSERENERKTIDYLKLINGLR